MKNNKEKLVLGIYKTPKEFSDLCTKVIKAVNKIFLAEDVTLTEANLIIMAVVHSLNEVGREFLQLTEEELSERLMESMDEYFEANGDLEYAGIELN